MFCIYHINNTKHNHYCYYCQCRL